MVTRLFLYVVYKVLDYYYFEKQNLRFFFFFFFYPYGKLCMLCYYSVFLHFYKWIWKVQTLMWHMQRYNEGEVLSSRALGTVYSELRMYSAFTLVHTARSLCFCTHRAACLSPWSSKVCICVSSRTPTHQGPPEAAGKILPPPHN